MVIGLALLMRAAVECAGAQGLGVPTCTFGGPARPTGVCRGFRNDWLAARAWCHGRFHFFISDQCAAIKPCC